MKPSGTLSNNFLVLICLEHHIILHPTTCALSSETSLLHFYISWPTNDCYQCQIGEIFICQLLLSGLKKVKINHVLIAPVSPKY